MNFCEIKTSDDMIAFLRTIIITYGEGDANDMSVSDIGMALVNWDIDTDNPQGVKIVKNHSPEHDAGDGNYYWDVLELSNGTCTHFVKVEYTYSSWDSNYYSDDCISLVKEGTRVVVDWIPITL
jgi:hypothetical protein